jgi:hypothetical protein
MSGRVICASSLAIMAAGQPGRVACPRHRHRGADQIDASLNDQAWRGAHAEKIKSL